MKDMPDYIRRGAVSWHRTAPLELFLAADPSLKEKSPAATLLASADGGAAKPEAGVGGSQEAVEKEKARLSTASWRWEILISSAQILLISLCIFISWMLFLFIYILCYFLILLDFLFSREFGVQKDDCFI